MRNRLLMMTMILGMAVATLVGCGSTTETKNVEVQVQEEQEFVDCDIKQLTPGKLYRVLDVREIIVSKVHMINIVLEDEVEDRYYVSFNEYIGDSTERISKKHAETAKIVQYDVVTVEVDSDGKYHLKLDN